MGRNSETQLRVGENSKKLTRQTPPLRTTGLDIPPCRRRKLKYISYFAVISGKIGHFKHFNWEKNSPHTPSSFGPPPSETFLAETLNSIPISGRRQTRQLSSLPLSLCVCVYRTHYEQSPLQHRKSGLLTQVATHRRFICVQNVILWNDQVPSHRRLAAHKSGCT